MNYPIHAAEDQRKVSDVVEEQDHDAHQPHVSEVAEENEESAEAVVKGVFVEVALRTDEDVRKEATEVLSELQDIEIAHFFSSFVERKQVF
jgi:prolyl-tRNA editing enzyme YbaK/EbsC (Cys-tRNA(Pro) deacylase)